MKTRALPCLAALLLLGGAARADLIVVPAAFATTEANSSETATLGTTIERYQQAYGPSLLTGLNVGDQITGLTFRVNGGATALPAQTVANYEIRLSQSVNSPASLNPVFANNRGADEVIARSGPLVINPGDFPGLSVPNPFGVIIPFTTPYTYQGGTLLLEVAHTGFPLGGRNADASNLATLDARAGFGAGFGATTADLAIQQIAIVVQFDVARGTGPAVPEPSALALVALGALGLAGWRWRRRHQVA